MALVVHADTIVAPTNQGARGLFNAVVAWLVANPGVVIIDVDTFRYESAFEADEQRLRIIFERGLTITGGWQARFYQSSTTVAAASAQEQFNADMQAGATFIPWMVVDLTRYTAGRSSGDTFMVLGVDTSSDPYGCNLKNTWIAEPQAGIAAGASGACKIYDGAGTWLGTESVKNLGSGAWAQFQRDYVVIDQDTGALVGLPTCDPPAAAFTPPVLTTTTPFPCPTYYPQTVPNTPPY